MLPNGQSVLGRVFFATGPARICGRNQDRLPISAVAGHTARIHTLSLETLIE
jgi:hypothetical protein